MLDPNPNAGAAASVDTGFDAIPITATVSPALAPERVDTGFGDLGGTSAASQQATPTVKAAADAGGPEDDLDARVAALLPNGSPTDWAAVASFMEAVVPWPASQQHAGWVVLPNGYADTKFPGGRDPKTGKYPVGPGKPFKTVDGVISYVSWANKTANIKDIFFVLSLQRDVKTSRAGKLQGRKSTAAAMSVKAIWLDVDVGKEGAYPTVEEALEAVILFTDKNGLPPFSAIVGSGGGVHVYWISKTAMTPTAWRPFAEGLKALAAAHGLKCDLGLTTDVARMLRMPGTFNHKLAAPRPCQLFNAKLTLYDFPIDLAVLPQTTPRGQQKVSAPPYNPFHADADMASFKGTPIIALDPADKLGAGVDKYSDQLVDPRPIFKNCAFYRDAFKTGGEDHKQDLWMYAVLGTTFMVNGRAYAHEISKGHADYSPAGTDAMYDRKVAERRDRGLGYPQCSTVQGAGCKFCAMCPLLGKIKSPLNLGTIGTKPNEPPGAQQTPNTDKKAAKGDDEWPDGYSKGSVPVKGYANTLAAFRKLGIKCTLDTFRQKEFSEGHQIDMLNGELSDRAVTMLRDQIRTECQFYPDKETVREAITAECLRNRTNPVVDYFDGLTWDGTPRISKLLHNYLGAEDTPLNEAIGVKLMCAIVRRSKRPGCKYDHQVVLQSGQGVRKGMFCEDLAVFQDLFTDAGDLSADSKQLMEVGQGKQIMEFPEHAGHSRAKRDKNKATLTRKGERARPAYGHYAIDAPRQWVGIATVNPGGYMNDPTGERRYWPVAVSKYDRGGFLADKDQLYAEAVAREPNEKLWLDTPDLVKAHDAIVATAKEPNTLVDDLGDLAGEVWETGRDKIDAGWAIHREERVSNNDARGRLGIVGIEAARMRDIGMRISEAMMALGWTKAPGTLVCKHGGKPEGGYRRPLLDDYELVEEPMADASDGANANVIAFVKEATRR
jgi:hypothetical protein